MERPPSRSFMLILFGFALCVAAGTGWFLARYSVDVPAAEPTDAAAERSKPEKQVVHLYFGDSKGRYLTAEQRVMELPDAPVLKSRRLLTALLSGPQDGGSRTFPQGARLRSIFIGTDGVAFVDLAQEPLGRHPGGVETELLSVYSIVNTLVLNVETVRSVKLLIGGREAATLAGHVDLSRAFKADMLWIR